MRGHSVIANAAVALATIGVAFPQARLLGAERPVSIQSQTKTRNSIKIVAPNSVLDVKLDKDGALTGRTIDHNGRPVTGARIVVKRGKTEVAQSTTDEQGNFAVKNLKTGLYEVNSGKTVGTYRVWNQNAAPPSAKPHSLLVLGENGARGQYGLTETIAGENLGLILLCATTGLALSALILALHAEDVAQSANEKSP